MKEKPISYDWAAYYQAAYEKEKKKNILLVGKIEEVKAKEADLTCRINRIEGSIFWKMLAPIRKCRVRVQRIAGKEENKPVSKVIPSDVPKTEDAYKALLMQKKAYKEEVFRQKHPYLQWIAANKKNNNCDSKEERQSVQKDVFIQGWRRIELENTDLCIIISGCGILNQQAEDKIKSWFNGKEACLFAYTDEDYYWKELSNRMHPWYKPCWSPDTMLSFGYVGHMIVIKKSLCDELVQKECCQSGTYADFYDLCLRLEEKSREKKLSIGHIEEVLFHNCYKPDLDGEKLIAEAEEAGKDVLETVELLLQEELEQGRDMTGSGKDYNAVREAALQRRGIQAHLESGENPDIYHVVYEASGFVSVIIPSKDHPEVLEQCLASFREKTDYDNYEWIVVDNGSNPENRRRMEALQREYGFLYLYEPMEFNFSAMCNLGARKAKGDYLLLLNDDIEIIQKDWLAVMLGQAMQSHVGAVGAKLWYADSESIQHAGITNLDIGPSHKLITFRDNKNYYYGHNQVTYDMIGVTAACLMVEKKKYFEVGGMDEEMKVAYNDVDFCFKLLEAGYYNVLRNDAVLYHHESLSRGLDEEDDGKWDRLLREKENLYAKHPGMQKTDVFYHKFLIDNASHYACNFKFDYENHLKTTENLVKFAGNLAEYQEGLLQLTIDRAEKQHKIHREEPDIMMIMGWCYLPGEDNAEYTRKLVLQRENGDLYQVSPFPWSRKDVERILTNEVNISLSGFVLRTKTEKLQSGNWRIGMIAENYVNKTKLIAWSDKTMWVE